MRFDDPSEDAEFLAKLRKLDHAVGNEIKEQHFFEKYLYGTLAAQKEACAEMCRFISKIGELAGLLDKPLSPEPPSELLPQHLFRNCWERAEMLFFLFDLQLKHSGENNEDLVLRILFAPVTDKDGSTHDVTSQELQTIAWIFAQLSYHEHIHRYSANFKDFLRDYWRKNWPYYRDRPISHALLNEWLEYSHSIWAKKLPRLTKVLAGLGINVLRISKRTAF